MGGRPLDVLESALGEPVAVQLKDGTRYRGALAGYDQHLNIVLEDVRVGPDDAASPDSGGEAREDTIVIRGDTVATIHP